VILER